MPSFQSLSASAHPSQPPTTATAQLFITRAGAQLQLCFDGTLPWDPRSVSLRANELDHCSNKTWSLYLCTKNSSPIPSLVTYHPSVSTTPSPLTSLFPRPYPRPQASYYCKILCSFPLHDSTTTPSEGPRHTPAPPRFLVVPLPRHRGPSRRTTGASSPVLLFLLVRLLFLLLLLLLLLLYLQPAPGD
ncbi:hypothetical protein B0T19DRAFT_17698 [Cercophora scortea]|uniref:Uncharacterized protein n=1 Tax=Cercophora scortea TaxID=314031 RepID=A0AAE0J2J2_9PEZI|nr:hypothetical protein B0T19DRAFT_17698 [Cercophora scortea]